MACPICGDPRDDGVCSTCTRAGYIELGCGCIESPDGTRRPCSARHALCEHCGVAERQATDTLCGDCRATTEHERPVPAACEVVR